MPRGWPPVPPHRECSQPLPAAQINSPVVMHVLVCVRPAPQHPAILPRDGQPGAPGPAAPRGEHHPRIRVPGHLREGTEVGPGGWGSWSLAWGCRHCPGAGGTCSQVSPSAGGLRRGQSPGVRPRVLTTQGQLLPRGTGLCRLRRAGDGHLVPPPCGLVGTVPRGSRAQNGGERAPGASQLREQRGGLEVRPQRAPELLCWRVPHEDRSHGWRDFPRGLQWQELQDGSVARAARGNPACPHE